MKITRQQLRRLISEAMYDPNTFPSGEDRHIPQSMIVSDNPEYREKVSTLSGAGDEYFKTGAYEFNWEDGGYYNPNNDLLDELIFPR